MSKKILKSVHFETGSTISVHGGHYAPELNGQPDGEDNQAEPLPDNTADEAAQAFLNEAQAHVESMLTQARAQVSMWEEEAQRAGREKALAEARQAVEAEMSEALTTTQALIRAAQISQQQFFKDSQGEIGKLAVAIAEKIIGRELTLDPSVISDIVGRTIEAANVRGSACIIRVNPQDYELLNPLWNAIPSFQQPEQSWDLVADKQVSRGGCLIEVANGSTIDAQIETQLSQIATAFETMEQL